MTNFSETKGLAIDWTTDAMKKSLAKTIWVDTRNGLCYSKFSEVPEEVIGHCECVEGIPSGPSQSDHRGRINWIMRVMAEKRYRVDLLKQQQFLQLRQVKADLRSFEYLFGEELEEVARRDLEESGKRTLHLDYGTCRLRSSTKWVIEDQAKLLEHCKQSHPDAVKTTEKVLVSELPKFEVGCVLPGAIRAKTESFSISTKLK